MQLNRHKISLSIRVAVAIVLIAIILRFVNINAVISILWDTDWLYALAILLVSFLDRYIMAYKWSMLLRARGVVISNMEAFRIYLLSGFVGTFLPTSVGADLVKLARTVLSTGSLDQVTASVAMERAIGLIAVTVLALGGLGLLVGRGENQFVWLFYSTAILLGVFLGLALISMQKGAAAWLSRRFSKLKRYRIIGVALDAHTAYVELGGHKTVLLWFFLLSLLEHGILSSMNFLGGLALDLPVGFLYFLALIPVASIIGFVPVSVSGLGVTEGLYVVLFSLAGLPGEASLALAIYMRALGLIALVPGAIIFFLDQLTLGRPKGIGDK